MSDVNVGAIQPMAKTILVTDIASYRLASANDLIKLLPVPCCNALVLPRWLLDAVVIGIVKGKRIHITGPTGTAKTSLVKALERVPDNFDCICRALNLPQKSLLVKHIESCVFETPGEVIQRRAVKNGTSYDEYSLLVNALRAAETEKEQNYVVIFLKEMGRVHSAAVQGGFLNLMERDVVELPDGTAVNVSGLTWLADSNYGAEHDATHALVLFDDALKRRFNDHISMEYLTPEQEMDVITTLIADDLNFHNVQHEWIDEVVRLGQQIRQLRTEGSLTNVVPPTIDGYLSYLSKRLEQPYLDIQQVANIVFFGPASSDERKQLPSIVNQLFGIATDDDMDFADVSFI